MSKKYREKVVKRIVILLLVLFGQWGFAQDEFPKDYFRSPLNIPIELSGTFAEIRPNHYHSGLDIRIGAKIGEPVYATADGYVSRINISPWGGGKVLYIDHDNGYRTVYMHLNDFVGGIGEYVKKYQYTHQCYSFVEYLPKDSLKVKKGQLVAHAGNTGSSGGPHLHYEVRYANNDEAINPFYFGLQYVDKIKPTIRGVKIYPENAHSFRLTEDTVDICGRFYVGIYATDVSGSGGGKNGVEKIELFVDDELWFVYQTKSFMFEETRSVHSCIDYAQYQKNREYYIITRRLPGMRNKNHQALKNDGYLEFPVGEVKRLRYKVSDYKGNCRTREFYVRSVDCESIDPRLREMMVQGDTVWYVHSNKYQYPECEVNMQPYTIYEDDELIYNAVADNRFLSKRHTVKLKYNPIPPHYAYELKIKEPKVEDKERLVIVQVGTRHSACMTKHEGGWLVANVKNFGDFAVMRDVASPQVRPVNFTSGKYFSSTWLKIKITDNLSGLKSYACYVDGEWVLGEYDGKTATIIVKGSCLHKGKNLLEVKAEDMVGNQIKKQYVVYR